MHILLCRLVTAVQAGTEAAAARRLLVTKNGLVVLKKRLHGNALRLNVGELALNIHGSHNGWGENDSNVQRRHLKTC